MDKMTFKYGEYIIHEYLFDGDEKQYKLKCEELSKDNRYHTYYSKPMMGEYTICQWATLDSLPPDEEALFRLPIEESHPEAIMFFSDCYIFWLEHELSKNPKLKKTWSNNFTKWAIENPVEIEGQIDRMYEFYRQVLDHSTKEFYSRMEKGDNLKTIINEETGKFIGWYCN